MKNREGLLTLDNLRPARMALDFIRGFQGLQADAAATNVNNGFTAEDALCDSLQQSLRFRLGHDQSESFNILFDSFRSARKGLKLMLSVGELGETLEAVRKNVGQDKHIPEFTAEETEVADCIIRLMNYATDNKLRLAEAIVAKNAYNRNRADHSAESRASEHGKKF
jgi:NTP pyrophosphatase (non-canonical NTP hydrolase)